MKDLDRLLEKLRLKKPTSKEGIPKGYVKCTRCGRIVPEANAVMSLPEEWWVCDSCYFGHAT